MNDPISGIGIQYSLFSALLLFSAPSLCSSYIIIYYRLRETSESDSE